MRETPTIVLKSRGKFIAVSIRLPLIAAIAKETGHLLAVVASETISGKAA